MHVGPGRCTERKTATGSGVAEVSFWGGLEMGSPSRPGAMQPLSTIMARSHGIRSISAGCPHLARRLSGPALERMREGAHLMKAKQPRNLGYMQLAVIKVAKR
jgi:hypothetical protein